MEWTFKNNYHFVINPSTRKVFQLPYQPSNCTYLDLCYLFGFDESRNEHKILNIRKHDATFDNPTSVEIMIFSMSSYSWRKIDAELPVGVEFDSVYHDMKGSVCVNSVIHFLPCGPYDILAFDLRTDKFSVINTPQGVVPHEPVTMYEDSAKENTPFIININGLIGVVCHDRVIESDDMHIWILQDYENRVWVREIITFPEPWVELDYLFPIDAVNTDEIIFSSCKVFTNDVMSVPIYNRKSRCFKSLELTLGHEFICSKTLRLNQIKCYVESILPL
ncbi:hypothetical protein L1987_67980 [Smallanthus sonchifolius]|uniref:Uncharacterized protein n=1 Tax=Smallanthus sonchifolius TaxID=185202 RepID=A0ACB9B2V9_9ASTR|nr:hypothetical protein L1987_67980 [Smallanthus sonchifolius]